MKILCVVASEALIDGRIMGRSGFGGWACAGYDDGSAARTDENIFFSLGAFC